MRALIGAMIGLGAAACYAPSAPAGAPCGALDACPTGQQCFDGVCLAAPPLDDAGLPTDGALDAEPDGPSGPAWRSTTALPSGRNFFCAVVVDDHLFAIGGSPQQDVGTSVLASQIADDGSLGPWTPQAPLPRATRWHGCAVHPPSRTVFVLGGDGGANAYATVFSGRAVQGTIDDWNTEDPLPGGRRGLGVVVAGDSLLAIGGEEMEGFLLRRTIFVAEVSPIGTFGSWRPGGSLPEPDYMQGTVVADSTLFLTGGYAGGATVLAGVVEDDSIDKLAETTPLPGPRQRHVSVAVGEYVYVVGGEAMYEGPNTASALRAPIRNGTALGAWEPLPDLPLPLAYAAGATNGRHIYVVGGSDDTNPRDTVFVLTP